ncbi:MAG: histidine kinase [Actinomycetaceae bacterium]|nr:histidine kinase [Actinomycetaceae bacterium]MDU0969848.1 histidine kinase [Actinomycetaceae bacterium]
MGSVWATIVHTLTHKGHRRESLAYAAPYTLFLLIPVVSSWRHEGVGYAAALTVWTVCFVACYLGIWLVNDPAPRTDEMSRTLKWSLGVLAAIALVAVCAFAPGGAFFVVYVFAPVALLCPRNRAIQLGGLLLLACIPLAVVCLVYADRATTVTFVLNVLLMVLVMALIRRGIERDIDRRLRVLRDAHEATLAERERMASDLHDVLGQTLTAIATMSQLEARLIDLGRTEEARQQATTIAGLASEALAQMRGVVASRQILSIGEELTGAELLLGSTGIAVGIEGADQRYSPEVADLVAHVIREGAANVVHHSRARTCTIALTADGVTMTNDGVGGAEDSRDAAGASGMVAGSRGGAGASGAGASDAAQEHGGNGLAGLRARAEGLGEVTAARADHTWTLRLKLVPTALPANA